MQRPQNSSMLNTWLVDRSKAKKLKPGDHTTDISKVDEFWVGVRGSVHHQQALKTNRQSTYAILMPQRDNPHDSTAVAILAEGKNLIGYVPRKMAHSLYSQLGHLKITGHKLQVPIQIKNNYERSCLDAWACIPTRQGINRLAPIDLIIESFMPAWNSLDEATRTKISADGFHLDYITGPTLWKKAKYAPKFYFSRKFEEDNVDPGITFSLQKLRKQRNADAITNRKRRNNSIISDRNSGLTNAEISKKHGISTSLVQSVIRSSGLSSVRPKPSGLGETNIASLIARAERCFQAVDKQMAGASRRTIANQMRLSLKTVEKYLTDGKFYRDLTRNPTRQQSLKLMLSNPDNTTLTDEQVRQARADAVVIQNFNIHLQE